MKRRKLEFEDFFNLEGEEKEEFIKLQMSIIKGKRPEEVQEMVEDLLRLDPKSVQEANVRIDKELYKAQVAIQTMLTDWNKDSEKFSPGQTVKILQNGPWEGMLGYIVEDFTNGYSVNVDGITLEGIFSPDEVVKATSRDLLTLDKPHYLDPGEVIRVIGTGDCWEGRIGRIKGVFLDGYSVEIEGRDLEGLLPLKNLEVISQTEVLEREKKEWARVARPPYCPKFPVGTCITYARKTWKIIRLEKDEKYTIALIPRNKEERQQKEQAMTIPFTASFEAFGFEIDPRRGILNCNPGKKVRILGGQEHGKKGTVIHLLPGRCLVRVEESKETFEILNNRVRFTDEIFPLIYVINGFYDIPIFIETEFLGKRIYHNELGYCTLQKVGVFEIVLTQEPNSIQTISYSISNSQGLNYRDFMSLFPTHEYCSRAPMTEEEWLAEWKKWQSDTDLAVDYLRIRSQFGSDVSRYPQLFLEILKAVRSKEREKVQELINHLERGGIK